MPPKRAAATKAKAAMDAPEPKNQPNTSAKVAKKPAATKAAAKSKKVGEVVEKSAPKGRGRAKKAEPVEESEPETDAEEEEEETKPKATKTKAKTNGITKKAAPKKETATTTAKTNKRKASEEPAPKEAKKPKVVTKGPVINEPPKDRLHVFVFGEGTAGELGLGTDKKAVDVKRPRLNPNLDAEKVGVVQVVAGGMHCIALTHDNKILTWGVNDQGALGRSTEWDGGLKDMDEAASDDSDDSDDNNGLNPHEALPAEVDWSKITLPEGTRFVDVAAGDSCSFALTDDGHVYGWGTFRSNEGIFGFTAEAMARDELIAKRPILIPDLKNVTSIKAGANHALALDTTGRVFAWGSGQQNQLGRRVVERTKHEGLKPREFGLPKGPKKGIERIETGGYHSFAISKTGEVFAWGLNNFGETGIMSNAGQDDAVILKPQVVESLAGKEIISIKGGGHHSLAATSTGECLIWGRLDGSQSGLSLQAINDLPAESTIKDDRDVARIVTVPQRVPVNGEVAFVTACSDHNVVVTKEGKAWSWGFSANYQTGQGTIDDVEEATWIDNTAVRDKKLVGATAGGQFSILTAKAD